MTFDAVTEQALEVARNLARAGVPIFVAYPDPDPKSSTGFLPAKSWQTTKASPAYVDQWRPGRALCAVMGQGLDLLDADPRNGADMSSLNGTLPRVYGEASTPSGGSHYFVASIGQRSHDGFLPGLDYKGGTPDGQGRGFAFIAPTVRKSKVTGEAVAYRWRELPNLQGIEADHTGEGIRELLHKAQPSRAPSGEGGEPIAQGERDKVLTSLAGSMRRRGMTQTEIAAALLVVNTERCDPPLDESQVRRIAASVSRYAPAEPGAPDEPSRPAQPALLNLPEEFWTARECLSRIRQAAHSRHRSADAVFHVVLARVAAMIEPARIDTGVGSYAALNYCAAIVGPPGVGKTDSWSIACDLYPSPAGVGGWIADNQPLGTGEGLAEAFMGVVDEPASTPKGKPKQTRQQVRHNAFFFADEGEAMTRHLERSGATIGEGIRRAWKGTPLGQRNASADRTRVVTDYALGLAVGFQPSTILPLLADVSAGTPQRFVYASATDPNIPDVTPSWPQVQRWNTQYDEDKDWTIDACVREEICGLDLMVARLEAVLDPYDAHAVLTKVKIAGLLAAMEQRKRISAEDWRLAGIVWKTSQAVRDSLLAEASQALADKEAASHKRAARREMVIDEAKEEKALESGIRSVVNHVRKDGCGGCTRTCVSRAGGKYRVAAGGIDPILDAALSRKLLSQQGNTFEVPHEK